VLSGRAIENDENSVLDELVVTNTIPLLGRCTSLAIAAGYRSIVAEAVRRISNESTARCSVKT
jgi:ribose-phosphate pyrophosphokinase